jgi:acyl CoA:acetate/3-ketoacid CoA transferase beta subunit
MAVLEIDQRGFVLKELAPGVTVDDVKSASEASLTVDPEVKEMRLV